MGHVIEWAIVLAVVALITLGTAAACGVTMAL